MLWLSIKTPLLLTAIIVSPLIFSLSTFWGQMWTQTTQMNTQTYSNGEEPWTIQRELLGNLYVIEPSIDRGVEPLPTLTHWCILFWPLVVKASLQSLWAVCLPSPAMLVETRSSAAYEAPGEEHHYYSKINWRKCRFEKLFLTDW